MTESMSTLFGSIASTQQEKIEEVIKPIVRQSDPKSIAALPNKFDTKKLKDKREKKPEYCYICEDAFKKLLNQARFCKRCGHEVC